MMQRKKVAPIPSSSSPSYDDNAKRVKLKPNSSKLSAFCLPGVPAPLKLVLFTFLSFATLMVMTAKDHHAVFHYTRGRNNNLPEPLRVTLKKKIEGKHEHESSKLVTDENLTHNNIIAKQEGGTISFVESEKRLKRQLLKLLELQKEERLKHHGRHKSEDSVLGVKISNRYLGEDLLPYPQNKKDESEWEIKMNERKEELRKIDEREWRKMMDRYQDMMEDIVHNNHVDAEAQNVKEATNKAEDQKNQKDYSQTLTSWPSPIERAGPNSTILLKPAFGMHRSTSNAIFVFAEGYDLSIYLAFIESLSNSGYTGDVVISISQEDKLKPGVKEYLTSKRGLNIVGYEVEWNCFKSSGESVEGSREGRSHCSMHHVFGDADKNYVDDPRETRPVATARYELYWMWSVNYNANSWIMLIDARDTWFQLDPFAELNGIAGVNGGELHLYGENADAAKIGTSTYNRNWLINAYGEDLVTPYFDKQIICSGSTIGHQVAIETYLRAMVAQFDSTKCKNKGCDQGFHNYLYYSGQLGDDSGNPIATGISKVIVHDQGTGIINNLAALREKPLSEWGLYNAQKELVLNWDGSTSAVAHQYDRDSEVNIMVKMKKRNFEQHWKDNMVAQI